MDALPSLLGLLTFDAVARHLGFSKAGRELHITQGAVSHRIRALEEELGQALLVRSSRRVRLTEPGRALFRATEDAFSRLRRGVAEMRAASHPSRVTVSCSPSFAIRWLVPHLGDFREQFPDIDIHISAEDELVEPGTSAIDVCIRFGPGAYNHVNAERLTRETVVAVCSPLYAKSVGLEVPSDLHRCMLLHDDVLAGHAAHVGWREWCEAAGLADLDADQGMHFSHSHLALDAAAAGQGIALARRSLVRQDLHFGRLVIPFDVEVDSLLTYWLMTPRGLDLSTAVRCFRSWLQSTLGAELGDALV